MIDLSKLDADDRQTAKVYIEGGPQSPPDKAAGFEVLGTNSAEYRDVEKRIAAAGIVRARARLRAPADQQTDDAEALESLGLSQDRMELIARACTVGWFGFRDGTDDVPFSAEALDQVLTKRPRWAVLIAVNVETDANFTKG